MIITDQKKLSAIQSEFRKKFPFLKIEFYSDHHEKGEGSPAMYLLDNSQTIGKVRTIHTEGDLSIDESLKVGFFENLFFEMYGLNVQVFRKSGGLWLQTISTDNWTLAEQNEKGRASVRD